MEFFCIYLIDQRTSGVITVAPGTTYLGHAPTPTLRGGETFHFAFCSIVLKHKEPNRMWQKREVSVLRLFWSHWGGRLREAE